MVGKLCDCHENGRYRVDDEGNDEKSLRPLISVHVRDDSKNIGLIPNQDMT